MKVLEKKAFELTEAELGLQETLFHTANGYLGVRGNFEEGYPAGMQTMRGQYVNGFYDIADMKQAEQLYGFANQKEVMLNVADTQSARIFASGVAVTMFENATDFQRILNMEKGVSERSFTWGSAAGKLRLTFRRMASFIDLSLFTTEIEIESLDYEGEIVVESDHIGLVHNYVDPSDPRLAAEAEDYLSIIAHKASAGESYFLTKTQRSNLQLASYVYHQGMTFCKTKVEKERITQIFNQKIRPGEKLKLEKRAYFYDSARFDLEETAHLTAVANQKPLTKWYQEQQIYLQKFWENSQVSVTGDTELNDSLNFSLFSLLQAAGKDGKSNIAAKGLSGEGYEGHYFWDTEIYMMPFFTLTNPAISKQLITYRYSILESARQNARILGHPTGALYPWRTIQGSESSGYYPSGTAQYHINSDIAYGIMQYYWATGDWQLMEEMGAEIIFETARTWLQIGNFTARGFEIFGVTGPDEYTCLINNNYYTNLSAKNHLLWAVELYQKLQGSSLIKQIDLTATEIAAFSKAAAQMFLSVSDKGLHGQDDSFLAKPVLELNKIPEEKFPLLLHYHPLFLYRHQVCKQADLVLAYFLFMQQFDPKKMAQGFAYYEPLTTHDSSLSSCIFGIVATQLGDVEKGYRYFEESSKIDIQNTHKNTKDGIHAANMGGTYLGLVYGFAGLRLTSQKVELNPKIPQKWPQYAFCFQYHGTKVAVNVTQEAVEITASENMTIGVFGKEYQLAKQKTSIITMEA
ncbi:MULTISPECIES: glycoside hydrolase family 65 protein [Enterococcus]|uniref:Glycosyl hydrolase n=2 Tax=Enterococcus TaxID=1350 RepID=S1P1S3_9ENTE|nr:glycosyl hydrolase family 65 protein [Enterococcus dispar]EOT41312.1 hypothetical protein OMK_01483 [Enterococcus dispar ATCC 51266]EOW87054.1 hypothetical protein I569_02423 [Enterococcus dispar ATCC 51266]